MNTENTLNSELKSLSEKIRQYRSGEGVPEKQTYSMKGRVGLTDDGELFVAKVLDYEAAYKDAWDQALNIMQKFTGLTELPRNESDPMIGLRYLEEWCYTNSQRVTDEHFKPPAETRQETSNGKAGDEKTTNGKTELSKVPTLELLKQSESHTLEFKEIPECNTQQNRKNNDVLFPPLKTIAGFLNAEGGILLIGVNDSGKIKGIEQNLSIMKNGNNDKFQQKIQNYLRDRFEPQPIGKVNVLFEKFPEGTICRVNVQASKDIIIHLDNKVYVRDGNTTQLLKGRRLTDWIQQRRLPTALPSGK